MVSTGSAANQQLLPMNTIDEVESPSKCPEAEPEYPLIVWNDQEKKQPVLDEAPIVPIDQTDLNESNEEEDELLNRK